jgi:hypothetical protein
MVYFLQDWIVNQSNAKPSEKDHDLPGTFGLAVSIANHHLGRHTSSKIDFSSVKIERLFSQPTIVFSLRHKKLIYLEKLIFFLYCLFVIFNV